MAVPARHILQQRQVIGALARAVAVGAVRGKKATRPTVPGPLLTDTVRSPDAALVDDYLRLIGGDPSTYRNTLPPHLFPHWAFPRILRALEGVPYPTAKIVNGGCTLEIARELPRGEPLDITARLVEIDDNGRRALLTVRVTTGTRTAPDAITALFRALVPLGKGGKKAGGEKPRIPSPAQSVATFDFDERAGLDFAKATGDFNPIHWSRRYARAMGFPSVILHGFGSMSWSMEGLVRNRFAGNPRRLARFDANFTRPLVLPARASVYVWGDDQIGLGTCPGGPAFMLGSYATR